MSKFTERIKEANAKGKAITDRFVDFRNKKEDNLALWAVPGHFATSQSHINYYVDVTSMKVRRKEAREAARAMRHQIMNDIDTIDTIVCMDGTEVLGAYLADELETNNICMTKDHETMRVVCPESNNMGQLIFRENIMPSIRGRKIFLLLATATTGKTVHDATNTIEYYGGEVVGTGAIFSVKDHVSGTKKKLYPLFTGEDLPGYETYAREDCPYCKKGIPVEAVVNGFGYSKLN